MGRRNTPNRVLTAARHGASWRVVLAALLALVWLISGASKLVSPEASAHALGTLLPAWATGGSRDLALASGLGASELLLGFACLLAPRRRATWVVVIMVLALFSGALARLIAHGYRGSCGCFGAIGPIGPAGLWYGLLRNAGLAGAAASMLSLIPKLDHRDNPDGMETHTRCAASRAFTLVELLVSVLIIGILIALTLPSLRSTRNAARDARDAALIHDLLMALHAYASDFRDLAPYFGTPGAPDQPLRLDGVTLRNASYFSQARLYQHALHPGYIASLDELLYAKPLPTPGDLSLPRTPFTLAQGPYAAPDYWITEETPNDLSLYRPVGLNLVRFPSLKGEILSMRSASMRQTEPADLPLTVLIGMFDGSASARVWDAEVDARIIGDRPYGSAPLPVSATREGLFGRDF